MYDAKIPVWLLWEEQLWGFWTLGKKPSWHGKISFPDLLLLLFVPYSRAGVTSGSEHQTLGPAYS